MVLQVDFTTLQMERSGELDFVHRFAVLAEAGGNLFDTDKAGDSGFYSHQKASEDWQDCSVGCDSIRVGVLATPVRPLLCSL